MIGFKALMKRLEQSNVSNYYILLSKDVTSPNNIIKYYKNKLQFPELNYVELSGENLKFNTLNETIEKLPFMDQFSMVVVTKANFVSIDGKDKNKILKDLNKLSIPRHCVLILQSYIEEDENFKKNTKIPKLERQGATVVYTAKCTLVEAKEELDREGVVINNDIAFFIYEKVGGNLDVFINECKKISMLPKETLTPEFLNSVITKTVINSVFDIIDVLVKERDLEKGLSILNNLIERGTQPLEIFGALHSQIKLLYYSKQFALNGQNANQFATEFKIHAYRAKIGFEQSNKLDQIKLADLFIYCNEASKNIKLSSNPKIELEKVIVKLFK